MAMIQAGSAKTVTPGTGFQAVDPTKASFIALNLTSSAAITLLVGTTNTAEIIMGTSKANVEAGIGMPVGRYSNSETGALVVGANLNTVSMATFYLFLPPGMWACVRLVQGSVSVVDAVEQVFG